MEIKRLSTILKLIANPERMAILFLLLDGDRSITELAQALDSSPTGIAYHLWHHEAERDALPQNDALLKATLSEQKIRCEHGMDEFIK